MVLGCPTILIPRVPTPSHLINPSSQPAELHIDRGFGIGQDVAVPPTIRLIVTGLGHQRTVRILAFVVIQNSEGMSVALPSHSSGTGQKNSDA